MQTILMFMPSLRTSSRQKIAGAARFARERGWFLHVQEQFATRASVRRAVLSWNPIGCIADLALHMRRPKEDIFGSLPFVYIDHHPAVSTRPCPALLHDNPADVRLAFRELVAAQCASFAYLGMEDRLAWDLERRRAFLAEAHERGLPARVLKGKNLPRELASLQRPCGILAANDRRALDIYHAAAAAGLSIPSDIAVCGIDNDEMYCETVSPGLTSVEPDFEGAGYNAARLLCDEIERRSGGSPAPSTPPLLRYGPLRIVRRGSTMRQTAVDPLVRRALEFIRINATDPSICLDAVAHAMGCSRRLATLRFRKALGRTVADEVQRRRLDHVADLLEHSGLTVGEALGQSGYASLSFATRAFKRRYGLSPRKWRASARKRPAPAT